MIEVMITITTVFVSTLVLMVLSATTRVQTAENKARSRALQNVKALAEQMETVPISNLGTVFPHDQDIPEFDDRNVEDLRVRVSYEGGDPDARPLRYAIEARWTTVGGAPSTLTIHGMRAR